jgi:hypothetical protein
MPASCNVSQSACHWAAFNKRWVLIYAGGIIVKPV